MLAAATCRNWGVSHEKKAATALTLTTSDRLSMALRMSKRLRANDDTAKLLPTVVMRNAARVASRSQRAPSSWPGGTLRTSGAAMASGVRTGRSAIAATMLANRAVLNVRFAASSSLFASAIVTNRPTEPLRDMVRMLT